ncbi:uncharacterized protein LOC120189924 [Hibiscus syriacus]|uniref:uncharacterized protein LOC120189924 n=1 Tax=Hibiscus syriacus TaxID=106335 RepID=UPI0019243D5E|nr:uncharacterized protein LOC120189924 [Hibiscus syriacus]
MVATTKDRERVNPPMGDTEPEPARMGSIRFITALQSQLRNLRKDQERGLMYVYISINGKTSKSLVDTGATYIFISPEKANRCEFIVTKEVGQMKAVNSTASTICGGAKRVSIKLGSWKGSVDFTIYHMNDFDVVLGLDFIMAAQVIPVTASSCLMFMGEQPCVVPATILPCPGKKILYVIQFKKEEKKGETSFIVFLISKEDANPGTVPKNVQAVLRDFEDVMPYELPKELPPRRLVDHEIELILGVKPPAKYPYRMSPPELAELRKQLDELLQAGFIRLSKSPFGGVYVFHDYLDKFVVIYLDDIMIFSTSMEEYEEHLRLVLMRLRENQLFVKKEKCAFAQTQVQFLGHIIEKEHICMDKEKVKAIQEWLTPKNVSELRSFLGLANYYRRFMEGYSRRVKLLTDLLKKGYEWVWSKDCQEAFDDLKKVVSSEPMLTLPDLEKPLEVETDASDYAIGGVLLQDGHSVAFESRKLNETEVRYTAPDKELLAKLLKQYHDTPWARHSGWRRTIALLGKGYYWPQMRQDMMDYTNTSLICQQDKVDRQRTAGLLEPLPVPARPWESISLDFISRLPRVGDLGSILVVVDKFSKYATFILASKYCSAEETAKLMFKHVVKYWGIP